MIRVVIDTNVLVSGLLAPRGKEAVVLLALRLGLIVPCLSEEIVEEYRGVLHRAKFGFPVIIIAKLLGLLIERGEIIEVSQSTASSPHGSDTKFIHCAMTASAEFLITGNRRHFPALTYGSAFVVNAGELLARIRFEENCDP